MTSSVRFSGSSVLVSRFRFDFLGLPVGRSDNFGRDCCPKSHCRTIICRSIALFEVLMPETLSAAEILSANRHSDNIRPRNCPVPSKNHSAAPQLAPRNVSLRSTPPTLARGPLPLNCRGWQAGSEKKAEQHYEGEYSYFRIGGLLMAVICKNSRTGLAICP